MPKSQRPEYKSCNDAFKTLAYDMEKNGYYPAPERRHGSHFRFINRRTGKQVTINTKLNDMVARRIRKECGF